MTGTVPHLDSFYTFPYTERMSAEVVQHPDDALFDPIAYATGAEGYDRGVTWAQLSQMDALLAGQDGVPDVMLAWRRSYMEGYLAAQRVKAAR